MEVPTVFVKEGEAGVSLFMVLSGFILTIIAYGKELDYRKFVYNRFIRIYPLYLTMIFIAAYASNRTVDFLQFLQLISPLANVGHFMGSIKFPHLWTIAVEFQFYLIFPLVIGFLFRYGARYVLGVVLLALSVRAMLFLRDTTVIDAAYSTIVGRIDQFCIGMLMAMIFKTRSRLLSSPIALVLSAVAVYLWFVLFSSITRGGYYGDASAYNPIWIISPTIEAIAWAGLALAYLQQRWQIPRVLNSVLCYLGGISFSMYAWHFPIVQIFGRFTADLGVSWYWLFLFFVLPTIVAVSSLSYYIIERPFFGLRTSYVKKPIVLSDDSFVESDTTSNLSKLKGHKTSM